MTTTIRNKIVLDNGLEVNCRIVADSFTIHADTYPINTGVVAHSSQMGFNSQSTWRYSDRLQETNTVAFLETAEDVLEYMEFRIRKHHPANNWTFNLEKIHPRSECYHLLENVSYKRCADFLEGLTSIQPKMRIRQVHKGEYIVIYLNDVAMYRLKPIKGGNK